MPILALEGSLHSVVRKTALYRQFARDAKAVRYILRIDFFLIFSMIQTKKKGTRTENIVQILMIMTQTIAKLIGMNVVRAKTIELSLRIKLPGNQKNKLAKDTEKQYAAAI